MRILIVEDEPLISMTMEDTLHDLGHDTVGPVASKAEALADAERVEVAFVDVRLSDGSTGPEIAACLHAQGVTVIFTTANHEMIINSTAALGFLKKPYHASDVAAALHYVLARRREEDAKLPCCLHLLQGFAAPVSPSTSTSRAD